MPLVCWWGCFPSLLAPGPASPGAVLLLPCIASRVLPPHGHAVDCPDGVVRGPRRVSGY